MRNAVNVAIVLALAAVIAFLPGFGLAAGMFVWLVVILFWSTLAWFASRLYRQYRDDLFALGDGTRAVLYVSVAILVVTVSATARLWETPAGLFAWFALVGGAILGVLSTWRRYRAY